METSMAPKPEIWDIYPSGQERTLAEVRAGAWKVNGGVCSAYTDIPVTVTCRYSKWSNTCLLGLLDALKDPGNFKNLRQLRWLNFVCFLITKKWSLLNLPSVTFNKGWQCMLCQLESFKRWRLLKLLPSIAAVFVIADQQSLRAVPKVWTLCKS